ncbi:hypothetical protein [Streptomyces sp. NPDC002133]|uniref:hypothetical protein n=1 Tax=Streptomyces sp. NPDC002133 TaxID=3154409 RepID=UPI00332399F1
MARIRHVFLAAACVAVLALLPGCSPPRAGASGIAVAEDGKPLGVMVVCRGHIDGATLYTDAEDDRSSDGDRTETVGQWTREEPLTGFVTWRLDIGGERWLVDEPMAPLEPHRSYHLYGWAHGGAWSAAHIDFTLAHLADLEPGQVRYFMGKGDGVDQEGYKTASFDDFRTDSCWYG